MLKKTSRVDSKDDRQRKGEYSRHEMTFVKDTCYVYENRDEMMVNAYEENTLTVGGVPHC